jgi:hypothetical protein
MQCSNNLKQSALALHNYHDTYKVFPPALLNSGRLQEGSAAVPTAQQQMPEGVRNHTGWLFLLPFYEGGALNSNINFNVATNNSNPIGVNPPPNNTVNVPFVSLRSPMQECPSHNQAGENRNNAVFTHYSYSNAKRTSYFFSTGITEDRSTIYEAWNADPRQGAFGNNGAAKFAGITDGTSNCLALGEGAGGRMKTAPEYGPWGMQGAHTCCHGRVITILVGGQVTPETALNNNQWYNWTINGAWRAATTTPDPQRRTYAWVFSSFHPGGAQFALCDGSTQFLSDNIDFLTFARLAYIHDGQPVQIP